jgi:carbon storage regulator CsrA
MLVLSRKQDQEIIIGDNIKIKVLRVKGNTIRLGIEAPREVKVVRGELPAVPKVTESSGPTDAEAANVTVVFSNDSKSRRTNMDIIPFADSKDSSHPAKDSTSQTRRELETRQCPAESITYRQQLPASLRHNRLKQLVKELTREQN